MALGVYTYFVTIVISNFHCTPRSSCLHIRCHQVFTPSQSRPFVSTVRDCEVTDTTLTNILKRTFGLKLHLRSFEGFLKILLQCCTINMAATEDKQLSYGWLRFRPSLLQFLNTPKWFLFFLSQYFFTQSIIVNGVYPGSISTIEKRFGYSSYMIGMMTSSYDIAAMIITPLISYIGGSRKKPLFCAWGLFAMGVGFFIFMLPHFVSPPYDATAIITNSNTSITDIRVTDVELCWANRTDQLRKNQCKEETAGGNTLYYALFVLGMVVAGAGCTPMYALGIPYMDENVKAKVTPMYVGIFVASGILGAAVGFVLISRFLLMFVEPGVQTSLTIQDKRWVGNWWIGFAIFGAICVFWSIWILGFPKEFPLTKKRRELDISATNTATIAASKEDSDNNHESIPKDDIGYSRLKDLPKATKLVFSSLPFLFVTVGACLENFVVAITGAFLPKVIETQFYQPPARAALLYGLVAVPSAFCGNILGAYINKRLKLNMTDSARMCFIVALLGLVSCGAFLLRCNTPSIAGVNALYSNSSDPHQLSAPCNQACNCGKVDYTPVCDGPLNYFSPCHAGCNRLNTTTKGSFYSNCACAAKSGGSARQVKKGNCYIDCGLKFLLFMVAVTLTPLLTFMNNTPGLVVTLRSVPPGQQSYALGLQMDLARVLGAIPGPIIFGALLDKTCILWSSRCGHRGFCLEYDHDGLAQVLVAVMAVCKLITATSFFLCWFFCQREKNTADKNTKENDEESFCCHETSV